MKIDLRIDSAPLVLRLQNGQRWLAYAVVNAINNTAKRIQEAEPRRVEEEPRIVCLARSRNHQAVRERALSSPKRDRGRADARLLLSAFERGEEHEPFTPIAARVAVQWSAPARPQGGAFSGRQANAVGSPNCARSRHRSRARLPPGT